MKSAVAAIATSLCLAACGSTVQVQSTRSLEAQAGALGDNGQGLGQVDPLTATPGGESISGGSVEGAPSGQASGSGGAGGTNNGVVPSSTTSSAGPKSATPVEIGFLVSKDAGAAFAALGYSGLSTGSGAQQAKAVSALLNAGGGVAGRRVSPVVFEQDASADASQFQTACSTFFDDHHVKAVLAITFNDTVMSCAAQHGVPMIAGGGITTDRKTLDRNTHLALPNQMSVDDVAQQLVDGLVRQGWFRPASATEVVKIGLVTHDDPQYARVQDLVSSRLQAAGLSLTDTAYQPYPRGKSDTAPASSAGRSNVLRFQSKGINRVVAVDAGGFGMSWFGISALSQNYFPRYGMSTLSEPSLEPAVLTPQQLAGSAGIGWDPVLDTSVAQQRDMSRRTPKCLAAMRAAGEDTTQPAERVAAESLCEASFTLQDAWRARSAELASFQRGLAALGTSYQPVSVFGTDFRRSRAAVDRYRAIRYDEGCDCYLYSGAVFQIP